MCVEKRLLGIFVAQSFPEVPCTGLRSATCVGARMVSGAFFLCSIKEKDKEYLPSAPSSLVVSRSNRGEFSLTVSLLSM